MWVNRILYAYSRSLCLSICNQTSKGGETNVFVDSLCFEECFPYLSSKLWQGTSIHGNMCNLCVAFNLCTLLSQNLLSSSRCSWCCSSRCFVNTLIPLRNSPFTKFLCPKTFSCVCAPMRQGLFLPGFTDSDPSEPCVFFIETPFL